MRELFAVPLNLPSTFAFSQSSLQSYVSCPRRFWLAYVEQLKWPALEAAPYDEHEELLRLGWQFHQLVERAEASMPTDPLAEGLEYPLDEWFESYLRHRPADLPTEVVEVERELSAPLAVEAGHFRLAARYDLIAVGGEGADRRAVVLDWKTNKRVTRRSNLQQRMQTLVYPYVLVEASAGLPWGPLAPEQVEMRYWFTAAPAEAVSFGYNSELHAANRARLEQLLNEILSGERERDFPKVADTEENRKRFCGYCIYRSRCDRGIAAGDLDEFDEEEFAEEDLERALEFSLEEIQELAF
ncbi:MAG: PD-(D/E)XK nuclease family protein [Caldilineaceae bacterium]|nr:PD-(D/E)XK nuclease family protein [Caldilineaceae bacterium]